MDSPEIMPNDVYQSGTSLRQKAEAQLEVKNSETKTHQGFTTVKLSNVKESETDPMRLLHELEVHRIELEMQNEELKLAVDKAATATALYDFAPAGYFTLNRDGLICQLNLSGAKLLGKERSGLIDSHFIQFIEPESLPVFNDFFLKIFQTNTRQVCELWLVLQENPSFFIHLEGIISE
ncbi:MAG: PAS domain-containing protein, partial [Bacteroidota bacterium]|nr:PAS domain-containing protein [Bacteroidota bacterium]